MDVGTYDNPIRISYRFAAATLSSAAVVGRVIGPAGRRGRVTSLTYVITTATTTAASVVTVDTNAGVTTNVDMTVPVATANNGGSATKAAINAGSEFPADTVIEISSDGGSAAGAADLTLVMDWY